MVHATDTTQITAAKPIPCLNMLGMSYPPNPMMYGVAEVDMGVINALRHAAWIKIISPTGLPPMDAQVAMAMGWKISMVPRLDINWVRMNGMMKKISPSR